jgi:hypothetical protein
VSQSTILPATSDRGHANRVTGETLPGLLRAQDVSHFHGVANHVRSIDEANAKKREFEEAQRQKTEEGQSAEQNTSSDGQVNL